MRLLRELLKLLLELLIRSLSSNSEHRPHHTDVEIANSSGSPSPRPTVERKRRRRRSAISDQIREAVDEWRGVPYRMGGIDRSGVDCSGFVQHVYAHRFDVDLPRTTRLQSEQGQAVSAGQLRAGDLVFFKISQRTRHVGAYLGNGEFGHASSSKGPIISRLDSRYWKKRYWTARRVLKGDLDG